MSLVSLAIRLATFRALKGRTYAGDNVFDSTIAPLNLVAASGGHDFFITVTTDDGVSEVEGRELFSGRHRLELVLEFAAMSKLTVDGGEEVVTVPATDAGLETTLNLIGWQIFHALQQDGGEWGDLWRRLVTGIHEVQSRRGADESSGVRYAARQIIIVVDHLSEPSDLSEGVWPRVIDMLKSDPSLELYGKAIEATVSANRLEGWEQIRGILGLANDESGWISTRPLTDDAGPLNQIELEDGFTIDAGTAADADGPEADQ